MDDTLLLSDLPEPVRGYADAIGLENLKRLAQKTGGTSIYIPTEECLDKYSFMRRIQADREAGQSINDLSKKYGVSVSTVYRYLNSTK